MAPVLCPESLSQASSLICLLQRALLFSCAPQRVMNSRRDDSSRAAAKAAEEFAARAMRKAEEAIRRAEVQDKEEDTGPTKCFAIFKAEGFGMLEAMSQVSSCPPWAISINGRAPSDRHRHPV